MFWKAVPEDNWPQDREFREAIMESWVEPFGDMRQELVFIGQNLDQEAICQRLDDCLLDEEQLLAGKNFWQSLNDPFPAWSE